MNTVARGSYHILTGCHFHASSPSLHSSIRAPCGTCWVVPARRVLMRDLHMHDPSSTDTLLYINTSELCQSVFVNVEYTCFISYILGVSDSISQHLAVALVGIQYRLHGFLGLLNESVDVQLTNMDSKSLNVCQLIVEYRRQILVRGKGRKEPAEVRHVGNVGSCIEAKHQ